MAVVTDRQKASFFGNPANEGFIVNVEVDTDDLFVFRSVNIKDGGRVSELADIGYGLGAEGALEKLKDDLTESFKIVVPKQKLLSFGNSDFAELRDLLSSIDPYYGTEQSDVKNITMSGVSLYEIMLRFVEMLDELPTPAKSETGYVLFDADGVSVMGDARRLRLRGI